MSDSMNFMEKNSDFKLWKQRQFVCSYTGRFSTILLVLFGNILRYIGFEVATYKIISLAGPAELGLERLPILLSLPAHKKSFKIPILNTLFSESC